MVKIIRRFFQKNFCAVAKAHLLDVFDWSPDLLRAVVLIEMSPLARRRITYMWQEFRESCHLEAREVNLAEKRERTLVSRDISQTDFEKVISFIAEAGGTSLGNYSGAVRDGVYYSLCWGYPTQNPKMNRSPSAVR